jgi:hypothetical protein
MAIFASTVAFILGWQGFWRTAIQNDPVAFRLGHLRRPNPRFFAVPSTAEVATGAGADCDDQCIPKRFQSSEIHRAWSGSFETVRASASGVGVLGATAPQQRIHAAAYR